MIPRTIATWGSTAQVSARRRVATAGAWTGYAAQPRRGWSLVNRWQRLNRIDGDQGPVP